MNFYQNICFFQTCPSAPNEFSFCTESPLKKQVVSTVDHFSRELCANSLKIQRTIQQNPANWVKLRRRGSRASLINFSEARTPRNFFIPLLTPQVARSRSSLVIDESSTFSCVSFRFVSFANDDRIWEDRRSSGTSATVDDVTVNGFDRETGGCSASSIRRDLTRA